MSQNSKPGRKCLSRAQMAEPYELSQDLLDRQQEVLSNRYGGQAVANQAANTIQRAYRRYSMGKKFAAITSAASIKSENRLSRRFAASMSQQQQQQFQQHHHQQQQLLQQQQQMLLAMAGGGGGLVVQQQYHLSHHQQRVSGGTVDHQQGMSSSNNNNHHHHHHHHQFFVERSRPPDGLGTENFHHGCCVFSSGNSKASYAGKLIPKNFWIYFSCSLLHAGRLLSIGANTSVVDPE
jgi:hypothetical protein